MDKQKSIFYKVNVIFFLSTKIMHAHFKKKEILALRILHGLIDPLASGLWPV